MLESTGSSTDLRVRVSCRPALLGQVLCGVLSSVSGIKLLEPTTEETADVLITANKAGGASLFDEGNGYPRPTKLLITIDRFRNVLYVRRTNRQSVGISIMPGEIPVLLNLLRREVSNQRLLLMKNQSA